MVILNKTFGRISFSNSALRRTTTRYKSSFQKQFQTINFHNFIFISFDYKIQLSEDQSSRGILVYQLHKEGAFSTGSLQQSASTSSSQRTFQEQLAEKQLQQNLSTDQKQLQNNKLSPEQLSAAQLQPAQLPREDFEQRACNNLCQEELGRALCFSDLLSLTAWLSRAQPQNSLARTTSTSSSLHKAASPRQKKKLAKNSFSEKAFQKPA